MTRPEPTPAPTPAHGRGAGGTVVLVTHDSFALPKTLVAQFERQSGYHLVVHAAGDGGTLTNKLVLTKDDPTGDVAFGVDNTFASRALDAGVFAPYDVALPPGAEQYLLAGDDDRLAPDRQRQRLRQRRHHLVRRPRLAPPRRSTTWSSRRTTTSSSLPGATTSSPGLAFLLGTIGEVRRDGWQDYWTALVANGAKVTDGWSEAYETDFTQGGGDGDRPDRGVLRLLAGVHGPEGRRRSTTEALLDTCFRQVEYAGVLTGAANPTGAEAFVDFLLSPEVQGALPDAMYVFPVRDGSPLPAAWAGFAVQPTAPVRRSARPTSPRTASEWLQQWTRRHRSAA